MDYPSVISHLAMANKIGITDSENISNKSKHSQSSDLLNFPTTSKLVKLKISLQNGEN